MESQLHMDYVRKIVSYINEHFSADERAFLLTDLPESTLHPNQVINGYRPDALLIGRKIALIGEAKTYKDIKPRHTKEQFVSYIKELQILHNDKEKHLIICSSAMVMAELKNTLRHLHNEHDFSGVIVHVINDLDLNNTIWHL